MTNTVIMKTPVEYARELMAIMSDNAHWAHAALRTCAARGDYAGLRTKGAYYEAVLAEILAHMTPLERLAVKATNCEKYRGYTIAVYDEKYVIRAFGCNEEGHGMLADQDAYADRASARVRIDMLADGTDEALAG